MEIGSASYSLFLRHPSWEHAWLRVDDPYLAYEIWKRARWPEKENQQIGFYMRIVGEYPEEEMEELRATTAYANDPEVERLKWWQEPSVTIGESPF